MLELRGVIHLLTAGPEAQRDGAAPRCQKRGLLLPHHSNAGSRAGGGVSFRHGKQPRLSLRCSFPPAPAGSSGCSVTALRTQRSLQTERAPQKRRFERQRRKALSPPNPVNSVASRCRFGAEQARKVKDEPFAAPGHPGVAREPP